MNKLGQYIGDTKRFFVSRLGSICTVLFPALIPINLAYILSLSKFGPSSDATFFIFSLSLALYPLYQGALILFIHRDIQGRDELQENVSVLYKSVLPIWSSLIILYTLVLVAAAIGFALFVLPGLYIIARLSFAEFECLLKGLSPLDAIKQSWSDTEESQFVLMAGLIVIWAATALPVLFMQQAISYQSFTGAISYFLLGLFGSVITVPITIFRYRMYSAPIS